MARAWKPEQRYEGRDLAVTTDFRDVFGEVVVRHLALSDTGGDLSRATTISRRISGLFA